MWLHAHEGVNCGGLKNDSLKQRCFSFSEFKNIFDKNVWILAVEK